MKKSARVMAAAMAAVMMRQHAASGSAASTTAAATAAAETTAAQAAESEAAAQAAEPVEKLKVALILPGKKDDVSFNQAMFEGMQKYAEAHPDEIERR